MNYIIGYLMVLLALSSGSILGSTFFNKRYEEMVPITVTSSIMILYVFYIFDLLKIGFIFCVVLMVGCYLSSLIRFFVVKKERKKIISNFFTPGLVIFVLASIIIWYIVKDNVVMIWDELRLWGMYPKVLYYTEQLQIGDSSLMLFEMRGYPPAMPLFQYFFAKCAGFFIEGNMHLAYSIFGISFLLPITKKITWKKGLLILPVTLLLVLFPLAFSNSGFDSLTYYKTLYIDPALGMAFGYAMYVSMQNVFSSKIKTVQFVLSLGVLILLKQSGFIFAAFALLSFAINEIFVYKNYDYKLKFCNIKNYLRGIIIFVLAFLVFFSWKVVAKPINSGQTNDMNVKNIATMLIKPDEREKGILSEFKNITLNSNITHSNSPSLNKYLTYVNFTILFILTYIVLALIFKEKKRKAFIISAISIILCLFMYTYALLAIYVYDMKAIWCFPRYIDTAFLGLLLYLVLSIADGIADENKSTEANMKMLAIAFLGISILIFPFNENNLQEYPYYTGINDAAESYTNEISSKIASEESSKNDSRIELSLFFSHAKKYGAYLPTLYHHQMSLALADERFYLNNGLNYIYEDSTYEALLECVADNDYDYIYFIALDEEDLKLFNDIMPKKIGMSAMFKVNRDGEKVILTQME